MKKAEIISTLKQNKQAHIKEYALAIEAFRKKATIELEKATKRIKKGSLELQVSLVTPVKRVDYFNNVIRMFQDDTREELDLTQNEYNEYILDQGGQAISASLSNSAYYHTIARAKLKGRK